MKKRIVSLLLTAVMIFSLLPVTASADTTPTVPDPADTIKAHRDISDEEIYYLTRCDSSTLKIGDEIAWLDESYTESEFASVGVPNNSGIIKIVQQSSWRAYYPEAVNFYLDVLKSGKGFDGCEHGTLNHNVSEYNCWGGGVQHLKGKAFTFISKPIYSKVTFHLNIDGAPALGKKVELYDGNSFFPLTDKGNGVYTSSTVYIGDYSIYVDGKSVNLGVNVEKTPAEDGYLCDVTADGQYTRKDDRATATAYYSGHEYVVNGNFYNYNISVKYNDVPSDALGKVSLVTDSNVYSLNKTGEGAYSGTLSLPKDISSEAISIYVGSIKTATKFQTETNQGGSYNNNNIVISFYTAKVTALLDGAPMSGYTVSFDNGVSQYFGKTNESGIVELPVQIMSEDADELPYTVKIEGTVDNTGTPVTLSSINKGVSLNYHTLSFYRVEKGESKSFLKQYVRYGSIPNKVANAPMEGYVFDFWSETPWEKDENPDDVTRYDFTQEITASKNVYAHVVEPTLDIYNTYIGTDIEGKIVSDGSASAFRMPAVTITGFPKGDVLKCFNLELSNVEKVYFYNTDNLTISQAGSNPPTSETNGKSTTASKVTVSFPDKASMTWVENYIRENVVFVPEAGQEVTIKLTVSDDVISVEDTSTIEQNPCTTVVGTKLTSGNGVVLTTGSYYIDDNVTLTGATPVYGPDNTNDVAHPGITIQGDVCLFIPSGKTLTVKGSDAVEVKYDDPSSSATKGFPGAAGILLEEGNTLYIYGGGTVKTTGGAAEAGGNGGDPFFYSYEGGLGNKVWNYRTSSGQGGYGGGGAGAGIGTNGHIRQYAASNYQNFQGGGGAGQNGQNGEDAVAVTTQMGSLYVAESIHLEAKGGAASNTVGRGGAASSTEKKTSPYTSDDAQVGGCGGGGGGYGGHAAANIGQGGAAGATGGTGGTGGFRSNYGQGGGGLGANGNNGGGEKNANGGSGGAAGNDTIADPQNQTYGPASTAPNHLTSSIAFKNSGSNPVTFNFVTGGGNIVVPGFTDVQSGMQFMGWKVETYGKTFGTAGPDNPLTTAESKLYQPGDTIQLQPYTYGDIVMAPIIEPLPANAANDTLTLTTFLGAPQSYEYTLKVTKNGQAADLGTFVFHGSDGEKYNVNSGIGNKLGTYTLTLAKDITISSISAIDLNNITIKDGSDNLSINDGETKQAAFASMEVAVIGKTVGEVTAKGSSYTLAYDNVLSTADTAVFSYFTQTSGDSGEYTIVIDGEEVPTAIAKAEFGTRATVAYSTVNVSVTTNVTDVLSLCLKADGHEPITLIESGAKYTATVFSDAATEYTLYINDHPSAVTCTLNEVAVEKSVEYYEVTVVSKVDGAEKPTDHTILVGGARPATVDNTTFTAFAFSKAPLTVTSNGETVATVTPSTTLGNTYIDYYTVSYDITGCTGTVPVDSTLYLSGQEATVASTEGLSASAENSYAAGWQLDDKVYNEGDTVKVTGTLTLTALVKQDDLIIHYVDHSGEVGTVKRLPLTEKITIAEMQDLHSFFTDGLVEYSFKGWTLDVDVSKKVYKIYEETDFTPQGLLGGAAKKEVTFRAVYDVKYLNGITIEAALPEGKTVQGINQVGQTFTIDYRISGNDGGINKLVLIPAYDSASFAIDSVTPVNTTGLGTGTVTDLGSGKYTVAFDSNDLYNSTGEIVVSITYEVTKLTSGDHDFGFVLNYAKDTLNDITFDNRSYAYRNPVTPTGSLDPSQEVKITFDGSKIKARTLTDSSITIAPNQSVPYTGNAVTIAHEGLTGDLHFTYGGYDKQEDCVQNAAEFTYTWYDKDGQPLKDAPKDAGTYSVGVSASASDYYNAVAEVKQTFTISKTAKPAGTPVDYEVNAVLCKTLSLETIGITLQGAKITKVEAVSGETGKVLNGAPTIITGDTSIGWTTVAQPSGTENDQYTLTVSSDNYNDFTVTVSFKGKIPVIISGLAVENAVYDSQSKTGVTGTAVCTANGTDVTNACGTLVYTYYKDSVADANKLDGAPTDAGNYKLVVSVPDECNQYIGSSDAYSFTIERKPITIDWAEDNFTYNKTVQTESITASYKDVDGTSHPLIVAVKQNAQTAAFRNAGDYTAEVTGFDTAKDPGSKNYALPETVTKDYTMKQKSVTVLDVAVKDKTYNGETDDVVFTGAAVFEGLCNGDELTLSGVTGEYASPNAGSQKVTLSGTWALSDNNYILAESGHATYAFGKIGKATQAAPTAPAVSGSTVTINGDDRTKKLEYCVDDNNADDEKAWISVPTLDANGAFTLSGLAAGDHTVYLRVKESSNYFASPSVSTSFTLTQYSVAYNANGGVGSIASQTANSGSTVTVKSGSGFSRTGYSFTGWNTKADGSGTSYAAGSSITSGATLYAQWEANTYTVRFNANGGSGTMENEAFTYDAAKPLTANVFNRTNYTFVGWATSVNGPVLYSDKQSVKNLAGSGTVTLYAIWAQDVHKITANIVSPNNNNDVQIKLQQGNAVYAVENNVTMAADGTLYKGSRIFEGIPAGVYNIVATQTVEGGKNVTVTKSVVLSEDGTVDIILPASGVNSELEVKEDTRPAVVGGLEEEAESNRQSGKDITVKMTVEKQEEQQLAATANETDKATQDAISEIKAEANGKTLEFMNIEIKKTTTDLDTSESTSEAINETEKVLELVFSYEMNGKKNIQIYRQHGDAVQMFNSLPAKPTTDYEDATFYVDTANSLIYVYAQQFSTYAIGYEQEFSGGGGGSTHTDKTTNAYSSCPQDETCVYAKFTDADTNAWYHDGVHFCVENGYMNGVSADQFAPSGTLSRAMIVTILWNMEGKPTVNYAMSFEDVVAGEWYAEAIRWAQSTKVVEGYSDGAFGPNNNVTREQLAAILMRYAAFKGFDVSERADLMKFTDASSISGWALENVKWANAVGIVSGRTETTIVPTGTATRAEAASMVQRFCEKVLAK